MSAKWLNREGERWVQEGVISRGQLEQIKSLYPNGSRSVGILPLLGGLLLGLGVLSFVAANWQALGNGFRVVLLLAAMIGSYAAGGQLYRRGHRNAGIAFISVGLAAFGGGMILIGQMYHLIAYSAMTMVIWSIAGVVLTYLFNSRYLFILSLALTFAAQVYSLSAFGGTFSFTAFAVLLLGLAWYVYQRGSTLVTLLWSLTIAVHALMLVTSMEWALAWFYVPLLLLYTIGSAVRSNVQRYALQSAPLAAAFITNLVLALFTWEDSAHWLSDLRASAAVYLPLVIAAGLLAAYLTLRRRDKASLTDLLLFAPLMYAPSGSIAMLYLTVLFLYAVFVLLRGYAEESRTRINAGIALFLLSTMAAYFKLTWAFMDKSLFFLVGGALLLALSWLLNRKKRAALAKED